MSRIAIPADIGSAPTAAQPLLQAVDQQLGSVPNLFRLVATSPAALEGYLGMSGALGKGSLPAPTRERRAEEPTSELQSLMRISYAVFCLKKKKTDITMEQLT